MEPTRASADKSFRGLVIRTPFDEKTLRKNNLLKLLIFSGNRCNNF